MALTKKARETRVVPASGLEEYVRLFAPPLLIVKKMRRTAKRKGLDKISMRTINQEIKRARRELLDKK
jgi:hypothetical protein